MVLINNAEIYARNDDPTFDDRWFEKRWAEIEAIDMSSLLKTPFIEDEPKVVESQCISTVPGVLYRFFDAEGQLLYVGQTLAFAQRMQAHKNCIWWPLTKRIDIEHFSSKTELIAAERVAIANENPKYNKLRLKVN